VALQIEYSLLERTVEHDLVPMAAANGLGITPWSPLKGGLLSGKYGRARRPEGEGRHPPNSKYFTERTWGILDTLEAVALEQGRGAAEVALAWVQSRSGVASPILGARTAAQLDANLGSLEVALTAGQIARLDAVSAPEPVFPHGFLANTRAVSQGGTEINGVSSEVWPLAPKDDGERW
jgi:aryl-alcohol dehydrogenase-like predicted oxidoreductase